MLALSSTPCLALCSCHNVSPYLAKTFKYLVEGQRRRFVSSSQRHNEQVQSLKQPLKAQNEGVKLQWAAATHRTVVVWYSTSGHEGSDRTHRVTFALILVVHQANLDLISINYCTRWVALKSLGTSDVDDKMPKQSIKTQLYKTGSSTGGGLSNGRQPGLIVSDAMCRRDCVCFGFTSAACAAFHPAFLKTLLLLPFKN